MRQRTARRKRPRCGRLAPPDTDRSTGLTRRVAGALLTTALVECPIGPAHGAPTVPPNRRDAMSTDATGVAADAALNLVDDGDAALNTDGTDSADIVSEDRFRVPRRKLPA